MDHGTNILKLLSTYMYMLASTKMYGIYFYYLLSQAVDVQCFSEQDCKAPPPPPLYLNPFPMFLGSQHHFNRCESKIYGQT